MKTVLLIEDDAMLADMYRDKLQLSNYAVTVAADGEKGLQLALEGQPDLILLDLALPKINGMDLMRKLRADDWGKRAPIIVLTNLNVDGKVIEEINHSQPVYCLIKANTTPEDIITKAKEILA